jgi:hypothetical protein
MKMIPTNLVVQLDLRADDPAAVTTGLQAAIAAMRAGVEPNMLWGDGYCIGIKVGPR